MKAKKGLQFPALPKDYAGLCRIQMPRPVHDRVEYANVAEVTDAMALWQEDFTADQRDYFDLLQSRICFTGFSESGKLMTGFGYVVLCFLRRVTFFQTSTTSFPLRGLKFLADFHRGLFRTPLLPN